MVYQVRRAGAASVLFETRRALGAFYTPADLAALVAEWAIDRADLKILEPSVGNGALLDAILSRLTILGSGSVEGFEIDVATVAQLSRFSRDSRVEVHRADFFDVHGKAEFDLVIANPPFTRNHELSPELRRRLKSRSEAREVARGAAGLWVYFVLGSLSHLRDGGRLAFVVPGAAEFVDYAEPVLRHLCERFTSVELIAIDSAVSWEGEAQERASVLLASGFQQGRATGVQTRRTTTVGSIAGARDSQTTLPVADHVALGSLARLEIGSVTGANDIFLLSKKDAAERGLTDDLFTLTVARARHVAGVSVTAQDLRSLADSGERTLLLTPDELGARWGAARRYLATISKARRKNTVWLMKRTPWWKVQLGQPFDGVLTYMNHHGPRLALLEPGLAATNTLHKLRFTSRDPRHHRTACLSLLSTYSQLHAESVGRVYGGGVLKFELKDARRLPLLIPRTPISNAVFARVDTAMRAGAIETARALADAEVLPEFFGKSWRDAQAEMTAALIDARNLRNSRAGKGIRRTGV